MFRGAVRGDLPQILQIYAHAREAMAASGTPPSGATTFPRRSFWRRTSTPTGCSCMWSTASCWACSPSFWGADPTYQVIEDGAWLNDTLPYGTIHRLASLRQEQGGGFGRSSSGVWSIARACGRTPMPTTRIMQHLLEKNGFTRCGIIHVADGTPRIAYQKLALTQQHS